MSQKRLTETWTSLKLSRRLPFETANVIECFLLCVKLPICIIRLSAMKRKVDNIETNFKKVHNNLYWKKKKNCFSWNLRVDGIMNLWCYLLRDQNGFFFKCISWYHKNCKACHTTWMNKIYVSVRRIFLTIFAIHCLIKCNFYFNFACIHLFRKHY